MKNISSRHRFLKPFFFFLGAFFFFLALGTFVFYSFEKITRVSPSSFLPLDVVSYVEIEQERFLLPSKIAPFASDFFESHSLSAQNSVFVLFPEGSELILLPVSSEHEGIAFVEKVFSTDTRQIELPYGNKIETETPNNAFIALRNNWLAFASDEKTRDIFLYNHLETLGELSEFKRLESTIEGRQSFYFFHQIHASDLFAQIFSFGEYTPLFYSFAHMYPFVGITHSGDVSDISFEFLSNNNTLDRSSTASFTQAHLEKILGLLPQENIWFFAGADFDGYYKNTLAFADGIHSQASLLLEGVLRAQAKHMFGDLHDFERDALPLLDGAYAFGQILLPQGVPHTETFMILEVTDEVSLETLTDILSHKASSYITSVVETETEDGETQEEIIAEESDLLRTNSSVYKNSIPVLSIENVKTGAQYSFGLIDNVLVVAQTETSLEVLLDAYLGFLPSLQEKSTFANMSSLQFLQGDQIFYAEPDVFVDTFLLLFETAEASDSGSFQSFLPEGIDITAVRRTYQDSVFWNMKLNY